MRRRTLLIAGSAAVVVASTTSHQDDSQSARAYEDSVAASRAALAETPDLAELIRSATLAANSYNAQPWRFVIRDELVTIRPDVSRRTPVVDPDDHDLFVSLGCAAENLALAGASRGRPVAIAFSDEQGGAVRCKVATGPTIPSDLADAIPLRQSTRAEYDGRVIEATTVSSLLEAARMPGIEVVAFTERSDLNQLRDLVVAANGSQWADKAFVAELKQWLRFNSRQALAQPDGLFSACLGNPQLPSLVAGTVFDWLVTADGENARYSRQIDSSSGMAVFFADRDDPQHWVGVGRAFERFALKATALGIKTACLNQPIDVSQYRADLANMAGEPGARPHLLVRFGYGPAMPYSVRRDVLDVLS